MSLSVTDCVGPNIDPCACVSAPSLEVCLHSLCALEISFTFFSLQETTRRGHPQTSHTHTSATSNFSPAPRHPISRDHRLRMAQGATYGRCRWQDSLPCAPYFLDYTFKNNEDTNNNLLV